MRVDIEATNVGFVTVSRHLVMTDFTGLLVWYWHSCRHYLRGLTLCSPI
jgi:hypothetical protein